MHEKQLFEYAVIRVVPRVEREEFLNVGVIIFIKKQKYLKMMYTIDEKKLLAFSDKLDLADVSQHLQAFEKICIGGASAGPIGKLDAASRFRWLTATRSTVVQTSKVHPGFCADPEQAVQHLYQQLVVS